MKQPYHPAVRRVCTVRWPLLFALLWGTLCGTGPLLAESAATEPAPPVPQRFDLRSQEPFGAVHIPFHLRGGLIFVQATLADRTLDCLVDTGCNSLSWGSFLGLPGPRTGYKTTMEDGSGQETAAEQAVLPTLVLGGCELHDVPGYAVDTTGPHDPDATKSLRDIPLLGNQVFAQIVLTIDYQKQEMIVRRPEYDFQNQPHASHDGIFTFRWSAHDPGHSQGVPVLQGTLGGRPVRLLLDTGWSGEEIGLVKAFREAVRSSLEKENAPGGDQVNQPMLSGSADMERLPQVSFNLSAAPEFRFQRPAVILPDLGPDLDGVIGPGVFRSFRVTIDYPRQRVLLEPSP